MVRCLLNIETNESNFEKYVVVLKSNHEFLMWSPSSSSIEKNIRHTSRNLIDMISFHIFKQHYLEAMNHKGIDDKKFNHVHKEIVEAWKNADKEVIEEYRNLSLNHYNYVINFAQDLILRSTQNRISKPDGF
ncbi:16486_t:CDS:1, partial [Funneliformis geosporum]